MESDLSYTHKEFQNAVWILATSPYDVRWRLYDAYQRIAPVRSKDLPEDLRADFDWVKRRLTWREPREFEKHKGKLLVNLERMRK